MDFQSIFLTFLTFCSVSTFIKSLTYNKKDKVLVRICGLIGADDALRVDRLQLGNAVLIHRVEDEQFRRVTLCVFAISAAGKLKFCSGRPMLIATARESTQ